MLTAMQWIRSDARIPRSPQREKGRLTIKLLQIAEAFLTPLGVWIESLRERVAVCPDCGRNRYTGKPCIK